MVAKTQTPTLMVAGVHDKQVPPERVVVPAGQALFPGRDAGDAFHVHRDEDLHGATLPTPTGTPRYRSGG